MARFSFWAAWNGLFRLDRVRAAEYAEFHVGWFRFNDEQAPFWLSSGSILTKWIRRQMEMASHQIEYAGFWRRFIAILIDWTLLYFLMWPVSNTIALLLPTADPRPVVYAAGVLLTWVYFSVFESSQLSATPGKYALGVKVTDMQGKRIRFLRATIRHFGKIVSALPLGIGFLSAASSTGKRQALHDAIANTLVVLRPRNPQENTIS